MAGKQIKQEIVLSGEKQYNAAIKEAQRNLKTLQSALKAETAELGKNATEQQKNEAKVKSLREQIKEQEKIVQTLRDALAAAKEEYGDNGAEVARWEQRLNNARTTLANMKNDLDGVGDGFKTVNTDAAAATVATKSVADALGSIGSAGESVSSAIESIFTGMIDTVSGAVEALWDMISETAARANNWTDIAGYWGTDAQTIQQYARAVASSADSFEDLQSAVSKIVLGGKGKTITELLNLSDVNYENEWEYAMLVMNRLSEMTREGQNMTPIYEQIFGEKKSTKVMDLVNDWEAIQKQLSAFNGDESGYGMSSEELSTMDELWVKINTIEQKWQALKDSFAAGFGGVSLDLLVNVEGTLDGIADYLNATDEAGKQAALDKIRANVEEFFTKLGEIIRECIGILREVGGDLQGSDDPLTSAIGDILVKLSESLQWMVDNADKVKSAFETIFGVWLLAKLAAVAGKLGGILMQIEAIKAFKGISGAGAAAGAAGSAAAGAAGSAAAGAAGKSVAAAAGGAIVKAVPWAAGLLTLFKNAFTPQGNGDILDENGELTADALQAGYYQDENGQIRDANHTRPGDAVIVADLGPAAPIREITEDVDLDEEYTDQQKAAAIQDWWDAWRNASNEVDSWDEEANAFEWMQEALGDEFDEVWDRILQKLDEAEDQNGLEDLPYDWYASLIGGAGAAVTGANENGITSSDLQRFNGLPAGILSAVKAGARDGVSGIRVSLDGRTVGQLLAPYVSEEIARDIVQ